jgi:hypothetical protein
MNKRDFEAQRERNGNKTKNGTIVSPSFEDPSIVHRPFLKKVLAGSKPPDGLGCLKGPEKCNIEDRL